jgi:hypothetical protein
MKLGCLGCLTLFILVLVGGGVVWGVIQALREPDIHSIAVVPADGVRAQQKIFEIVRRGGHAGDRNAEPIVFAERELNAFLARHLGESAALPLTDSSLRLERGGIAEVHARLPLRYLLREQPASMLGGFLPGVWLDRRVWLRVGVRPELESDPARRERRYLRLEVTDFAVGRQRLPALLLRVLLDPTALSVLRLRVPDGIDAITVEAGRLVVRPAS